MVSQYGRRDRRRDDAVDFESRLSSVETAVSHIESSMSDIRDTIRIGFQQIRQDIDENEREHKPQLSLYASWATVILIVLGMFGSGYIRDLHRTEQTTVRLMEEFHELSIEHASEQASDHRRLQSLENLIHPKRVIIVPEEKNGHEGYSK